MNKYITSTGEKVSQTTIDKRRSDTYRRLYADNPFPRCQGCGDIATCTAHIVPQARCKVLGLTELCWSEVNMAPACYECNMTMENISSEKVTKLLNFSTIVDVYKKYDAERYSKIRGLN